MSNTLGVYNPIFYAQEALIILYKALGMANRVHMGFDEERRTFNRGDTINIRRPSTFTAQDAPSAAQDVNTDTVSIALDQWKEVKFKLTDKELAYTSTRIIEEHIAPAAFALADNIDGALVLRTEDIPWHYDWSGTYGGAIDDLTGLRQVMFNNAVPLANPAMLSVMMDGNAEQQFLNNSAFTQWNGSGNTGQQAQQTGTLGSRFGFGNIWANQNTRTHTKGTLNVSSGTLVTTAVAIKGTSATWSATTVTGTVKRGDTFVVAGNTQRYSITADATAAANAIAIAFTPPAPAAITGASAVTLTLTNHIMNCAFHRHAFALAMARLPEIGNELGAKVVSVQDPVTGLSLRSRIYYVGNSSEVHVALDVLYGTQTLNPNLGVRGRANRS